MDEFYDTGSEAELVLPESPVLYPSDEQEDGTPSPTADEEGEAEEKTPQEQVDDALRTLDGFATQLSGTQGDWTRGLPCSDVFCITVELVSDTEDPVVEDSTANCVLCHLSFINQRLGETLDKSLVASKPSQNWFEDATCKEAGAQISLDLNVYTVAMPIDLDPSDDSDDAALQQTEDLRNTLVALGSFSSGRTQYGKTMSELECESILNLYDASNTPVSLDTAQDACAVAAVKIQEQVDEAIDQIQFEASVSNGNTLYEQASAELSNMLLLFRNIQDGLKKTYLVDDAPLSVLVAKPYCQ